MYDPWIYFNPFTWASKPRHKACEHNCFRLFDSDSDIEIDWFTTTISYDQPLVIAWYEDDNGSHVALTSDL